MKYPSTFFASFPGACGRHAAPTTYWSQAGNHVLFWLNPTALSLNPSVITLNPTGSSISAVPEPESWALFMGGCATVVLLRRRY